MRGAPIPLDWPVRVIDPMGMETKRTILEDLVERHDPDAIRVGVREHRFERDTGPDAPASRCAGLALPSA